MKHRYLTYLGIVALAIAVVRQALPATAPTTQPGSKSADYIQGWTDAGGIVASTQPATQPATKPSTAPATQPVTQPATQPIPPLYPTISPPPGEIAALLKTTVPHTRILLNGHYTISGTPTVSASDLEILCQPGTQITVTPAPGSTSGVYVTGNDFDFDGGDEDTTFVNGGASTTNVFRLFGLRARLANYTGDYCHNGILFDRNSTKNAKGVIVDAGGSDHCYIHNVKAGLHVGGQFLMVMSDYNQFWNITIPGSLGEQCARLDWTSWGHKPTGDQFWYCTFDNSASPFDKASLDFRNANDPEAHFCTISNMRIGELAAATSVGQWVNGYLIDSCVFTHLDSVVPSIDAKSGTAGTIQNSSFPMTPPAPRTAINVGTFATLATFNNTRAPATPGTIMAASLCGGSASTTHVIAATQAVTAP